MWHELRLVLAEVALDGEAAIGGGMKTQGHVTLVGAGPGDPELLTVKAIKAIRAATVLLVDDLVGEGVLRYARKSTRVIHVGKRGGCASTPQAFIQKLMLAEAQRGERVVRLKGGDPFVFGRGGEEVEHLREAGVSVSVVNGITSGLAAAAALGVPWTHREHARGVMLVTGHAKEGGAAPHWPTLGAAAAQGLTLVVYMGVAQLDAIAQGLAQALPAHTPAALVQSASTARERRWVSTLEHIAHDAQTQGFGSPAILVVGDVLRAVQAAVCPGQPEQVRAQQA
jgi:uroporphyrin-III C-methyltransferase